MSARVKDVMTTRVVAVANAARLMYHGRVRRLPVVGEKGQLVGIVSRSDVLSVYSRPDEEIRGVRSRSSRRRSRGAMELGGGLGGREDGDPRRAGLPRWSGRRGGRTGSR